jgi:hypothetical protein
MKKTEGNLPNLLSAVDSRHQRTTKGRAERDVLSLVGRIDPLDAQNCARLA